jgi:hypothetical protein
VGSIVVRLPTDIVNQQLDYLMSLERKRRGVCIFLAVLVPLQPNRAVSLIPSIMTMCFCQAVMSHACALLRVLLDITKKQTDLTTWVDSWWQLCFSVSCGLTNEDLRRQDMHMYPSIVASCGKDTVKVIGHVLGSLSAKNAHQMLFLIRAAQSSGAWDPWLCNLIDMERFLEPFCKSKSYPVQLAALSVIAHAGAKARPKGALPAYVLTRQQCNLFLYAARTVGGTISLDFSNGMATVFKNILSRLTLSFKFWLPKNATTTPFDLVFATGLHRTALHNDGRHLIQFVHAIIDHCLNQIQPFRCPSASSLWLRCLASLLCDELPDDQMHRHLHLHPVLARVASTVSPLLYSHRGAHRRFAMRLMEKWMQWNHESDVIDAVLGPIDAAVTTVVHGSSIPVIQGVASVLQLRLARLSVGVQGKIINTLYGELFDHVMRLSRAQNSTDLQSCFALSGTSYPPIFGLIFVFAELVDVIEPFLSLENLLSLTNLCYIVVEKAAVILREHAAVEIEDGDFDDDDDIDDDDGSMSLVRLQRSSWRCLKHAW